jgi:hypothetical protein
VKAILAAIGSSIVAIGVVAAIPIFVISIGAIVSGLGSIGLLAFRTYRRMQRERSEPA